MYDAVLEGVLVKVDWVRAPRPVPKGEFPIDDAVATVAVARRWQGMGPDTVVVRTALFTDACGLPFQRGDRYLLFARRSKTDFMQVNAGRAGSGTKRRSGWCNFLALEIQFNEA
jgi:hypothetical protein